ncbi:MAG: hypothetical protein PT118_18570 [Aphanizomenon gracile PMC644.10]|nr:hypothetical protein [Aphanizomenon gracile PMC627.10]MDM3861789.1 hypothetical protein [Aphanizomenon gracile PMC644.10]
MSADKLASFRVDSQLWEQFQSHAKENNTNASALLVAYIKSVVNTGSVITSNPVVNTSIEVNNPSLSLQDIDKRMDDKIQQSIHNINTLSLQDIDNKIQQSLKDGDIKDAIASSCAGVMGQINGLLEKLQALQKQVQELQSNPPAAVPSPPINEQLTTDNGELTTDNEQLPEQGTGNREQGIGEHEDVDLADSDLTSDTQSPMTNDQLPTTHNHEIVLMLGCQNYMGGKRFNQQDLKDDEIDKNIATNKVEIEALLETKINTKNSGIQRFVGILRAMGFEVKGGLKDGYYIANPDIY